MKSPTQTSTKAQNTSASSQLAETQAVQAAPNRRRSTLTSSQPASSAWSRFWQQLFTETPQNPLPKATKRLIFNQIILVFTIGCIFGTYYEELITLWKNFLNTGTLEWFSRRGLVYGPFSPVYGLGAVGIYLLFYRQRASWQACFFGGAVLGGAFEYILSLLQEWIFGTRSWNYYDRILNIDGRTTIPYMLFWGLLVLLAARWLFPLLEQAYQRLVGRGLNISCVCLAIFLAFDISMSIAANLRQTERREGNEPDTRIELFLDRHFPDERLKEIYDNTQPVKE